MLFITYAFNSAAVAHSDFHKTHIGRSALNLIKTVDFVYTQERILSSLNRCLHNPDTNQWKVQAMLQKSIHHSLRTFPKKDRVSEVRNMFVPKSFQLSFQSSLSNFFCFFFSFLFPIMLIQASTGKMKSSDSALSPDQSRCFKIRNERASTIYLFLCYGSYNPTAKENANGWYFFSNYYIISFLERTLFQ